MTCSHTSSRAWCQFHAHASVSDWFPLLLVSETIGQHSETKNSNPKRQLQLVWPIINEITQWIAVKYSTVAKRILIMVSLLLKATSWLLLGFQLLTTYLFDGVFCCFTWLKSHIPMAIRETKMIWGSNSGIKHVGFTLETASSALQPTSLLLIYSLLRLGARRFLFLFRIL